MANLYLEGFDYYPTGSLLAASGSGWTGSASGVPAAVSTDTPITGSRSIYQTSFSTFTDVCNYAISPSTNEIYLGFAFVPELFGSGSAAWGFGVRSASTYFLITFSGSGQIVASRAGTGLASSTATLTTGVKSYIEAHLTGTTYEILLNGVSVLSGSMTSIGTINTITFQRSGGNGSPRGFFDDIYVNDTSGTLNTGYLGEIAVHTLLPDTDETPQDWTLSGGLDAFDLLNNVPSTANDYIEAETVNNEAAFTFSQLGVEASSIHCARVIYRGQKTSVGPSSVQASLTQGSTTVAGTENAMTDSTYNWYIDAYETDPDTGEAWDPGTFDPKVTLKRTV